jgi:glycosyltransferase involved in cell wall biosynthesis
MRAVPDRLAVIVAARNEADRIGETLAALGEAFPGAALWVADDASGDGTAEAALVAGAQVVGRGRPHGKGANVSAAAAAALSVEPAPRLVLLCVALGFARWAIRRRCGLETVAPISGQRAMRVEVLRTTLPFARGYGMELGMTIDAVRAGHRVREYEIDLSHRATGRSLAGFAHRARQLLDFARVYLSRRGRNS